MFIHKVIRNQRLGRFITSLFLVCLTLSGVSSTVLAAKPADFTPVTLCHQEGNGTYNEITVSTAGALNGHQGHSGDVIPAPEAGCASLNPEVTPTADVQITKIANTVNAHESDSVTYTLTAHNNGPDTATDVTVNDILPSGLNFVSASPAADYNSSTGVWTIGTLANGADATLSIIVTVANDTANTTIANTATITETPTDSNPSNNSSTNTITIEANPVDDGGSGQDNTPCLSGPAHAATVVASAQGTLNNGDPITDATRTNPNKALGAADGSFFSLGKQGTIILGFNHYILDVPGSDLTVHEITNGRDTYPEERADIAVSQDGTTWINLGTASGLDFGTGISTFDISATGLTWIQFVRLTDATNFAIHDATADGYDVDAIDATYGSCTKLTLEKTGSYDSQTGKLSYTISWGVVGQGSADVTITDKLPTGTTYVSASADNSGVYDAGTQTITWTLGSKSAGSTGTVHFMATVDAALAMNQWAKTLVSFAQGKQANLVDSVAADRSDPTQALGVAQTSGSLYDNPISDYMSKFVSLGFTDKPTGGELVVAFDHPVYNGSGPDVKVFEVTAGDNYPDEQVKVSVSNDNTTWSDVGVVVRDGTVDLGANSSANYIKLTDTTNRNLFEPAADGYDVDAIQALQLVPPICSITNTAQASFKVTVQDSPVTVSTIAQTTTTIDKASCVEGSFKISGQKWNDLNSDGIHDAGEAGLAGWTIYIDTNDNGSKDQGEPSATTDQNGNYTFSNNASGVYVVREVGQAGWTQTYPALQSFGKHVVFVTDSDITGKDFGNHQTPGGGGGDQGGGGGSGPTGSITGIVFNDANNNGVLDNGEASLSGWVVYLDQNDNSVLDNGEVSKTTASPYLFSSLADGTYTVREVAQPTWSQTLPTAANALKYTVVISGGNAVTNKDFGNFQTQGGGGSSTSSSSGGGGGGGGGRVAGDTTTTPNVPTSGITLPTDPQVLGAVTELPRTGAGTANLLIPLLFGVLLSGFAFKKLKAI